MKNQTLVGFVFLDGRKIHVTVRPGQSSNWVSARPGLIEGTHLVTVENKLRRIRGVREKLLDGKVQAL